MNVEKVGQFGQINSLYQSNFREIERGDGAKGPGGGANKSGAKEMNLEQFTALTEKIAGITGNPDLAARAAADFDAMDKDGTGGVTRQEIHRYLHAQFKAQQQDPDPDQATIETGGLAVLIDQQEVDETQVKAVISQFDGDASETLNETELGTLQTNLLEAGAGAPWTQELLDLFNAIDSDGDAEVNLSELVAYLQNLLTQSTSTSTTEEATQPPINTEENNSPAVSDGTNDGTQITATVIPEDAVDPLQA